MSLESHVAEHQSFGCTRADRMLGIQAMPDGYALMLDSDGMYFYWLRHDGQSGVEHWNKWAVRKGAIANGGQSAAHNSNKGRTP